MLMPSLMQSGTLPAKFGAATPFCSVEKASQSAAEEVPVQLTAGKHSLRARAAHAERGEPALLQRPKSSDAQL